MGIRITTFFDAKSKERDIRRFLSSKLISPVTVMKGSIPELIAMQMYHNLKIILMLDQSKVSDSFQYLMVSMRVAERALPVALKVVETHVAIGFDICKIIAL